MAEVWDTEAPVLWLPDAKNQLIGKDPNAGKVWGQEEKGAKEDEMVGWHHLLNGHVKTPGDSEGQGSLVCCMQSMGSLRVGNNLATEQQQMYKFSWLSNLATNAYATPSLNCSISNWINTMTGTVREEKKYFLKRVCERDWVLRSSKASQRQN